MLRYAHLATPKMLNQKKKRQESGNVLSLIQFKTNIAVHDLAHSLITAASQPFSSSAQLSTCNLPLERTLPPIAKILQLVDRFQQGRLYIWQSITRGSKLFLHNLPTVLLSKYKQILICFYSYIYVFKPQQWAENWSPQQCFFLPGPCYIELGHTACFHSHLSNYKFFVLKIHWVRKR